MKGFVIILVLLLIVSCSIWIGCANENGPTTGKESIFTDPNLEEAVRSAIKKPTGDIIVSDLQDITVLFAEYMGIVDLTGLEYCTNLTYLSLSLNQISDIAPISSLVKLTDLHLDSNRIIDISSLNTLVNLELLYLHDNQIADISVLSNLTSLMYIALGNNQVSDIYPLIANSKLSGSGWIEISNNPLKEDSLNIYVPELESRGLTVTVGNY